MSGRGVVLHVGPLADWYARHGDEGVPTDADARREAILRWRTELAGKLAGHGVPTFDWDEREGVATAGLLAPDALRALRLLAVYADRADLELPRAVPKSLDADPVHAASAASDFAHNRFTQILVPDCWLPVEFDLTVKFPYPDGLDAVFGSAPVLQFQLAELNRTTFQDGASARREAAAAPPSESSDALAFARHGLAALSFAVDAACRRRVPLLLGG
jgi:hypothetical protein